jgi:hypothetical protein
MTGRVAAEVMCERPGSWSVGGAIPASSSGVNPTYPKDTQTVVRHHPAFSPAYGR